MEKYIIIRAKAFKKIEHFDKQINDYAQRGYRPIAMSGESGTNVLMEKITQ
ncbi:hypothetical protein N8368_04595 [Bacteroidia bacterium]|nr:hypothetical protein [Bacteroidia bacterium]MDC1395764.1 hypothetical protein [Bacteroidia bacterium]